MEQENTNTRLTSSQRRATLSYSAIAVWGFILSASIGFPFRDVRVISFINFFTMALTCLVPLYVLKVRKSYLVGSIVGLVYMIGVFIIDPPSP